MASFYGSIGFRVWVCRVAENHKLGNKGICRIGFNVLGF